MQLKKILHWGIFPALIVILCVSGGCIFDPRDPEPPISGESISYLPRTNPSNVWGNMQISLRHKDSPGWDLAISSDFIYYPDSAVEIDNPGVFDDWNKEKEIVFINGMFNRDGEIAAEMRQEDFVDPDPTGTEATWEGVIYFLTLDNGEGSAPSKYRASAEIVFRLEDNFWYVYSWRDMQGQSDPDDSNVSLTSMGVLRANFGSKKTSDMLK